jgi:hypothetical protein
VPLPTPVSCVFRREIVRLVAIVMVFLPDAATAQKAARESMSRAVLVDSILPITFAVDEQVCSDRPVGAKFTATSTSKDTIILLDRQLTIPDTIVIPPKTTAYLRVIPRPLRFPPDWNGVLNVFMDSLMTNDTLPKRWGDVVAGQVSLASNNRRCLVKGASMAVHVGSSGQYRYR